MSSVSCSICWETVTSSCIASYLACGHVYHHHCLEKWLKTSKTCPECRNAAFCSKRIYLNLVPDPKIEVLTLELTKTMKKFEFSAIDNEFQSAIIKQLEHKLSAKDKLLLSSSKQIYDLQTSSNCMLHENEKLKLELQRQEKEQIHLTNEIADLKNQLRESQTINDSISNSTVTLEEYYREQVAQTSYLHSQIIDLTERLDQFRSMFAATDNKFQAQLQENQVVQRERDSLLSRNTQLYQKVYSLKLQVDRTFIRKIKNKYNGRAPSSLQKCQPRRIRNGNSDFLKIKLAKNTFNTQHLKNESNILYHCQVKSSDSLKMKLMKSEKLKMKLVKSKLNWMCVDSS